ncbi:MAG: helix-turn-helix domain-containing protein [Pyrinomonadaceae bacterium]|nr:helix-turn-helix domain-containing protein [Pyrinomonadaceae bacterium]
MNLLSVKDAAEKLGVSDRRIRAMIKEEKIKAVQVGSGYVIEESELEKVKVYKKAGRPPKSKINKDNV